VAPLPTCSTACTPLHEACSASSAVAIDSRRCPIRRREAMAPIWQPPLRAGARFLVLYVCEHSSAPSLDVRRKALDV
jgi:hypothetical protein